MKARRSRRSRRNPSRRRRSHRRSHRNPVKSFRRRSSRRNSVRSARRNPRRGMFRRNPVGDVVQNVFNEENLKLAAGALVYTTGASIVINKLLQSRMALQGSIPGMKPGQVSPIGITLYKAAIGVVTTLLTKKKFPKFAEGVALGTVIVVGSDLLKQSNVLSMLPGAGVGRYLPGPRGAAAYTAGVSPTFTGPGSAFIGGGAPRSRGLGRNGLGTMMTAGNARNMVANGAANFSVAN